MNSFISRPFKRLNNWAKRLKRKKISDTEISFASRIVHPEINFWTRGLKEYKTTIFGREKSLFEDVLVTHGVKKGDIIITEAQFGKTPPMHNQLKTNSGKTHPTIFDKGTIRVYTPDGALRTILRFSQDKEHLTIKKYSPAGRWIGKTVEHKV